LVYHRLKQLLLRLVSNEILIHLFHFFVNKLILRILLCILYLLFQFQMDYHILTKNQVIQLNIHQLFSIQIFHNDILIHIPMLDIPKLPLNLKNKQPIYQVLHFLKQDHVQNHRLFPRLLLILLRLLYVILPYLNLKLHFIIIFLKEIREIDSKLVLDFRL